MKIGLLLGAKESTAPGRWRNGRGLPAELARRAWGPGSHMSGVGGRKYVPLPTGTRDTVQEAALEPSEEPSPPWCEQGPRRGD